ncbi:MAG: nitroreductase family protein [Methanomassiliicoccaceae archaeon]|nr:nitroreductase family protein [Methanomassiliicoccaceae archaeon]
MTAYPNDTVRAIMERRSIRKYKPQQITEQELNTIIECGLNAPSGMNTQNWHLTVIQNAGLIDWMNEKIKENMPAESVSRYKDRQNGREDYSMFYDAPTLILVSGDAKDMWTESNCGYVTQNMCLAAQSIGVASIIIGMARFLFTTSEGDAYAEELGVPNGYRPLYVVCFGYADMRPEPPARIPGKVNYIP